MDKAIEARLLANERFTAGWRPTKLLVGGNTKLDKSERTIGLSLAPAKIPGHEVCASSSVNASDLSLVENNSHPKILVIRTRRNWRILSSF